MMLLHCKQHKQKPPQTHNTAYRTSFKIHYDHHDSFLLLTDPAASQLDSIHKVMVVALVVKYSLKATETCC